MYYRRLLITCALCLICPLLWGQSGKTSKQLTKAQLEQLQADYIHACLDAHQTEILALAAEKLRPLVSKQIPPVPKGYH